MITDTDYSKIAEIFHNGHIDFPAACIAKLCAMLVKAKNSINIKEDLVDSYLLNVAEVVLRRYRDHKSTPEYSELVLLMVSETVICYRKDWKRIDCDDDKYDAMKTACLLYDIRYTVLKQNEDSRLRDGLLKKISKIEKTIHQTESGFQFPAKSSSNEITKLSGASSSSESQSR